MESEKINKLKKQYYKLYIDTIKHYQDIERWIKTGSRKQGDIRRSLSRLTDKYKRLYEIKVELGKNNIQEVDVLPYERMDCSLKQFENKIDDLYVLAGLRRKRKPMYTNVDLVSDIPGSLETYIQYQNARHKNKETSLTERIEWKVSKIKAKIKNKLNEFIHKEKQSKIKFTRRFAAFAMASTLAIFGGASVGENTTKLDNNKNDKSYVDTNHDDNRFKSSIHMYDLENKETTLEKTPKSQKNDQIEESKESYTIYEVKEKKTVEDADELFVAPANMKYTEVSDGTGNYGYFTKKTKVKVYNRALLKTNKDSSKEILRATKVEQSWKQFAEEKEINYEKFKEYIDNNKNVQEYVSLQSEDGKNLYGWVSMNSLEEYQDTLEEAERD